MAVSKNQIKQQLAWEKKAYFKTLVRFKAENEAEIRQYANGNLNGFIVAAVEEKIARMKKDGII